MRRSGQIGVRRRTPAGKRTAALAAGFADETVFLRYPQRKSITIEGWLDIAHSYAIVNQWQLLALMRRQDISVSLKRLPFYDSRWRAEKGLFDEKAEAILGSIPRAMWDDRSDVTLRISFPFDFSPAPTGRTAVFATLENQAIRPGQLAKTSLERFRFLPPAVDFVTPSRWSAEGFYKAGIPVEQVKIVPHGVDVETFHPMPELRVRIRQAMRIREDDFIFLTVGAMTENKGIDLLFRAFARVCAKFPHCRLLLKGCDPLYESRNLLMNVLSVMPPPERDRVLDRIIYFGSSFQNARMAQLYQVADIYVSPYRAEGFNLPVLEAAACGIPIICTAGGPTDDFVSQEFAKTIASTKISAYSDGEEIFALEPDFEHLVALMESAVDSVEWRTRAGIAGSSHVAERYTWDHAVSGLIQQLF